MQVSTNDTLAGLPLINIRDFLRHYPQGRRITVAAIESELGVPSARAELIAQSMVEAGFIEPRIETAERGSISHYLVTKLGSRLCVARFVKRITRANADLLVKQMLERIAEINARDELVFWVKRVRAFGSYASDVPEVGDVDLAVELERRYPDRDMIAQLLARADASGRRLGSYMDRLGYAELEVQRLLKGRSPYLAIEGGDCPEEFGVPAIQLFPDLQESE
jgi:predicted nucleotidyltransferase